MRFVGRASPRGRHGPKTIYTPNETLHRFSANLRIQLRQPEVLPVDVDASIGKIAGVFEGETRRWVRYYLHAYVGALTYGEAEDQLGMPDARKHAREAAESIRDAALHRRFHARHFDCLHAPGWFRSLVLRLINNGPTSDALPPVTPSRLDRPFDPHPGWVVEYPRYEPNLSRRSSLRPAAEPSTSEDPGRVTPPW